MEYANIAYLKFVIDENFFNTLALWLEFFIVAYVVCNLY